MQGLSSVRHAIAALCFGLSALLARSQSDPTPTPKPTSTPASNFQLQLMASPDLLPEEGAWNYGPENILRTEIGHAFPCIQDKTSSTLKEDCFGFYPIKRGKAGPVPAGDPNGHHVFEVASGDQIAFSAEGRWCWGRGSTECSDADGTPGRPTSAELPVALPGRYFGKLIGRVGNAVFPIGSYAVITSESYGLLYILMNDPVGFYNANSGELTIEVWRAGLTIVGPGGTQVTTHDFVSNPKRLSHTTESVTFSITQEQRRQIYQLIDQWNTKYHRLLERNCINFINDVLVQLGVHPPKASGYASPVVYVKACREQCDYHFEFGSFTNEMWINNKIVFKKPAGVDVEFVSAGAFDWVFDDANGKEVRTLRSKNEHGGWTSVDFPSLGLHGDYSIGFRNASSGEKEIKQGDVRFK
ncbi:hypothetical protein [Granulicella sp. L46]|uniref:hypothetical protein n=1 Tax=Granulicella sp. L46 TaxID=1641865 RepID=UPI00131EC90D|nr:hypothetical protein [Granulicella sp. L46]